MSLKITQITAPRTTPVRLYETKENGEQEEIVLNIRHKRLTPTVGREIDRISNSISKELTTYWEEQSTGKGKKDKSEPTRNATVEQLVLLVEYTDIEDEKGEIMPPTRETFERLPGNVLLAIMDSITNSVVPEKKSSKA